MNFSDMTDEKLINIIEQDKYRLSLAATMGAMQMCLFAKTAYLERILEDRNSYFVPKIIIPQPIQTNRNTTQYLQARLQNNLTQKQIREHGIHYIYAHSVGANIYIGRSSDVVRRWFEHCDAAYNINHGDYNSEFKKTIRKYGENSFIHDILYVAKSLEEAKAAEANAIQFYQANLNTKNELIRSGLEFNYREIKNDHTTIVFRKEKNSPWDIKDREPVIAEAFFERGRIRLRSVKGQKFGPGLRVECSRESRKSLNSGEKIIINVKLVTKLDGSQYLSGKNQHFETIA